MVDCRRDAEAPCADETMNPTSENLSPSETRSRGEAKGYCVGWAEGSIRGGEHSEATDWSQTQVNSIRPVQRAEEEEGTREDGGRASRAGGEIASAGEGSGGCWRSLGHKPDRRTADPALRLDRRLCGVVGVRTIGRGHGLSQDRRRGQGPRWTTEPP